MTPSESFREHVLDALHGVIYATASEVADAVSAKIQRRPHIESVRKTLKKLRFEGLVERAGERGYRLARTKPVVGSLRRHS